MKKMPKQPNRPALFNRKCSLILRLWQVGRPGAQDWRASVEIPEDGRRVGFASLEQLFAFLIDFTETNCNFQLLEAQEKNVGLVK
jgi:hypothetical protein